MASKTKLKKKRKLSNTKPKLQHRLLEVQQLILYAELVAEIDPNDKRQLAHLKSMACLGATDAFKAIPTEFPLRLPNGPFALKLADALYSEATRDYYAAFAPNCVGSCRFTGPLETRNHILDCKNGGGHIHRHDSVKTTLYQAAVAAGLSATAEPRAMHQGFGNGGPDIEVRGYPNDALTSFIEIAVVNPMQPAYVAGASKTPLHASTMRQNTKDKKFAEKARQINRGLYSAVIETTGALGPQFKTTIKKLEEINLRIHGAYRPKRTDWSAPTYASYWRRRIAVALAKGAFVVAEKIVHGPKFKLQG